MIEEQALTVALRVAAHVFADEDLTQRLFAQTGLDAGHIRQNLDDPDLLAGLLDFVLSDEKLVLEATRALDIDPGDPARARAALPGGGAML